MTTRVRVSAADPIAASGIVAAIDEDPSLEVMTDPGEPADVRVVVADTLSALPPEPEEDAPPTVLIVDPAPLPDLRRATESYAAAAVVPRQSTTPEALLEVIDDVARTPDRMPARLQPVLRAMASEYAESDPQPRLDERERAVLRLVADGCETEQIAEELHYSARMIKHILRGVLQRAGLNNRTQAVSWALRNGLL